LPRLIARVETGLPRAPAATSALGEEALAARRKHDKRLEVLHRQFAREVSEPRFVGFAPEANLDE
jgi:hypothetical protein